MKRILLYMAAMLMGTMPLAAQDTPAEKMLSQLKKVKKQGIMFAHQDDPVYGTTWKWDLDRSDVKEVCGDYPALMGFDLGKMELDSKENLDGVPFDRMRHEIIDQHQRGGFVTISWHLWNPVTGENAWDPRGHAVAAILPGGKENAKFEGWMDKVIAFFNSLVDAEGNKVPVIFRPWHEMHGRWFWWGSNSCTPDELARLFRYTYDYFKEKGVDNVVWCYSPGADRKESEERFMTWYPGDDYVDIIGVDIYCGDNHQEYIDNMKKELKVMAAIADQHDKLFAVAETGYRNTPKADWFTKVLLPSLLDDQPLYVLLWRNAWDQPEENFGPAPEKSCADDFRLFHADKTTLFLRDVMKINKGR